MDFYLPASLTVSLSWNVVSVVILVFLLFILHCHRRYLQDAVSDRSMFRAALDLFPDAFLLIDNQGRIAFANPQTEKLFGHDQEELHNASLELLIPRNCWEEYLPGGGNGVSSAEQKIASVLRRFNGRHKNGKELPLEAYFAPFSNARKNLAAAVLLRDITQQKETEEMLRQSEAHLRLIIEQMPAIVWTTDTELCLTSSQGAGLAALNLRAEEIIGMSMLEHLERDNMETTPIAAHAAALQGQSLNYEMEWKKRFFQVAVEPLRDVNKKITGTIGVVLDVTARKQTLAELEARASQQAAVADLGQLALSNISLAALTERAVAMVFKSLEVDCCAFWDLISDSKALRLRTSAWANPGEGGVEVVPTGTASLEGYTLDLNEPLRVENARLETTFAPGPFLTRHRAVSAMSTPISGKDRPPVGVLAVYSREQRNFSGYDLHFLQSVANILAIAREHKQAEEEQTRLAAVLEGTPDVVAIADRNRRLIYLNRAGRELLGLRNQEDFTKKSFVDFYPEEARKLILNQAIPAAIAAGFWSGETTLLCPNQGFVPTSQVILAHKERDGSIKFFSTVARDISKLKRLEEQFLRAQKMEAVGRLAGGVAHDFNNLLTVIMGFGDFLVKNLEPGSINHEHAAQIKRYSERAAEITRQLLAFSRHQVINPQILLLGDLVDRMGSMLRHLIGEDIELVVSNDPELSYIEADPGQMEQIVMNMVVNARDAMPTGGTITITTANIHVDREQAQNRLELKSGNYVLLTVSDTGCGMDEQTRSHLFEPFFTTKEMGKGTGLGLAIVYGIVQQFKGYIEVASTPGEGSTFQIYFPTVRSTPSSLNLSPRSSGGHKGTETVLVVEDQEGVRSLVRQSLEAQGYHVLVAADGQEALAICNQAMQPIHLLLTDVVMPRMSGPQLAKSIASLSSGTRILYMSGFADSALMRHGALAEGIDCLMKPFTPDALVRVVREVLDGKRVAEVPALT